MAEPPPYEDVFFGSKDGTDALRPNDAKNLGPQRLSIREEVGASRSQHVANLVSRVLPQIRERAKSGLSKTTLLLLPSDQADASRKGQLVGFPDDEEPLLIQLEGRYDGTQFWTQDEALNLLREQVFSEIAGDSPRVAAQEPQQPRPVVQPKSSFWGRKQIKIPEPPTPVASSSSRPPVSVDVHMEQINFRSETEFGLYETLRGRAVMVVVVVT